MPIPPAAHYMSSPLHDLPITDGILYLLLPVTTATSTQSSVGADMEEWREKMVSRDTITLSLLHTPHCCIGEHSEASRHDQDVVQSSVVRELSRKSFISR